MVAPSLVLVRHHKNTIFFFLFYLFFSVHGLTGGSSLSVQNNDTLVSPNGLFTAGFHQVGHNAYCFSVWFTDQPATGVRTVVWMANRDAPVNGKYSKLSLFKDGNLVLTDADEYIIWSTHTKSTSSSVQLELHPTDGRYQYINGQKASLDSDGRFYSSDGFRVLSADFGIGPQRMMKISIDGRRRCTCLHGYKVVNSEDWSYGCAPDFEGCRPDDEGFIKLHQVEFYGYDMRYHKNYTLNSCKKDCLDDCTCKGGNHTVTTERSYFPAATGFRKFTYTIKKLKNTNQQGEEQFQAEINTIGRLNHMNLIETWGYCAEGKHRLIVYEYMENGSLAGNLRLGKLDWETRFNIAKGTAKGLAYLHEECLDFGVVILEMITGRSPAGKQQRSGEINSDTGLTLVEWVRDRITELNASGRESWVEEIVNPTISGEYDRTAMENLVNIAVQCAAEDMKARPSMRQVVNLLLNPENDI
ncbi:hypothetical protein L2E82_47002 [Cichorium intybus]|uniref:Uncharacterized protein n=1 Tax=Cichorium intybus TaxID=13427 RepID=A0ACB8YTJ6_CICIN|nr:hypothetical protein L2E82_47002 [Cichorium intybus]